MVDTTLTRPFSSHNTAFVRACTGLNRVEDNELRKSAGACTLLNYMCSCSVCLRKCIKVLTRRASGYSPGFATSSTKSTV